MNSENLTLLAVGLPTLAALVTAVAVLVRRRGPGSTDDAEGTSTNERNCGSALLKVRSSSPWWATIDLRA